MQQTEKYIREHRSSSYAPPKADERDKMVAWQKKLSNCYLAMQRCNYPPDVMNAIKAVADEMKVCIKGE